MTQAKLMKLYVKKLKGELTAQEIIDLNTLTDEEIDLILSMNNQKGIIYLLKNEDFRSLPKQTQGRIISVIETYCIKPFSTDLAVRVATNKNAINSGYVFELTKLIASSDKEQEQVTLAYNIAINPYIIQKGGIVPKVISILNAKTKNEALEIYYEILNTAEIKEKDSINKETILSTPNNSTILRTKKASKAKQLENGKEIKFWDLFLENSDKAMEILVTSIFPCSERSNYEFYESLSDQIIPLYSNSREHLINSKSIVDTTRKTEITPNAKVRKLINIKRV